MPNYNPLNPYNNICMYVFRADNLALDKQVMCSSLERALLSPSSFMKLPIVMCIPCELFPVQMVYPVDFDLKGRNSMCATNIC